MSLLEPLSLAWLGLLVPLVALYVLKRRRTPRPVGSTMLWALAQRDLRAERPWQRLVPHVSLLLQALALMLGALALARPAGLGHVPAGARVFAVLDTSASMAAEDDEGRRIDGARAALRALARTLPPGGELGIVEGAGEPSVIVPPSSDLVRLEAAIDRLDVRGGRAALEEAAALAGERLAGAPAGSRIVVITDAAFAGTVRLPGAVPIEVVRVGADRPPANDAILAVDARTNPGEGTPDRVEIFARLERFGGEAGDVFVSAEVEGEVRASRRVTLTPGVPSSALLTADLPPDDAGQAPFVTLRIRRADDRPDALALDDVAVVPSPASRRLPVFLVGAVPESVRRVLLTDPDAELFALSAEALAERSPSEPALDGLFVLAGASPETAPTGDVLVIAPDGPLFGVELPAPVLRPRVMTWDEADPRLRFTSFAALHVASLRPLSLAAYTPLVTTDAGPAIASTSRPDGTITVVGFDPDLSDWPRQAGFVIFFRNLLEGSRGRRAAGGIAPGRIGEALRVPAPEGAEVVATAPDGSMHRSLARGGIAIVDVPALPGAIPVELAGGVRRFALRNLLDAEESDLRARAELVVDDGAGTALAAREAEEPSEAWPWLALGLLVVLALETLWATRRGATA
jgi:hypothetical protein